MAALPNDRVKRMDVLNQAVQHGWPVEGELLPHQFLRTGKVLDPGEAVVRLFVGDAGLIELSRQPLPSVQADLYAEREPGLQPYVHPAEDSVKAVRVDVQTTARSGDDLNVMGLPVSLYIEGLAPLKAAAAAHRPVTNVFLTSDPTANVLLG